MRLSRGSIAGSDRLCSTTNYTMQNAVQPVYVVIRSFYNKIELHVIKIINATFVARADQVKRRVLPTTITDDVDMVLAFQPCSFKDGYSFFTSY